MLESKGRIRFAEPSLDWVRKALTAPGLHLLPLTPEIAIKPLVYQEFYTKIQLIEC
jgi:PIN domain nuclease of toxin-antitoxin system